MYMVAKNGEEKIGYVGKLPVLRKGIKTPIISKKGDKFITETGKTYFCLRGCWTEY